MPDIVRYLEMLGTRMLIFTGILAVCLFLSLFFSDIRHGIFRKVRRGNERLPR